MPQLFTINKLVPQQLQQISVMRYSMDSTRSETSSFQQNLSQTTQSSVGQFQSIINNMQQEKMKQQLFIKQIYIDFKGKIDSTQFEIVIQNKRIDYLTSCGIKNKEILNKLQNNYNVIEKRVKFL
ncbi:Hypothetical_protein [Hexamita inflata]|uniref:Hypothetical_protein n=1 Tax=Hexamita inflata TaxID=28002 RepID=A0AA86V1E2_9EUKA|nr:Hypothetical protein HINF_LOCUS64439 [Hexamita inflata]